MLKNLLTLIICLLGVTSWGQLINDGATLTIQSGATLVVEGDVTNTGGGTINNNGMLKIAGGLSNVAGNTLNSTTGNIEFQGDSDNTVTLGANLEVNNFTINKTGGNVVFATSNDVTVKGNLQLNSDGLIVLGGTDLFLEGLITGTPSGTRYIKTNGTGFVSKVNQSGNFNFPVGYGGPLATDFDEYNPISVNNTGTASTIGVRGLQDALDGGSSGTVLDDVITASWEVTGGDADALNVTLNWDASDEGTNWDASISGVARWDVDHWDHSLDQVYGGGTSATRSGASAGLFAVGGESVMDEAPMDIQLVLSGPYNGTTSGTLMNTGLTSVLPTSEPYGGLTGFTHSGLGGNETGPVDYTGSNVVDWVFIELRDATTNTTIHGTYSALLLNTGQIVGPDLNPLVLKGLRTGTSSPGYNIAIRHRNHLGVMTSGALGTGTLSRTIANTLDFKGGSAFGSNPMRNNGNGVFSLWAGDVNNDKFIYFQGFGNDRDAILTSLGQNQFGFLTTYNTFDVNLDGFTYFQGFGNDRDVLLTILSQNQFGFIQGTIPN